MVGWAKMRPAASQKQLRRHHAPWDETTGQVRETADAAHHIVAGSARAAAPALY